MTLSACSGTCGTPVSIWYPLEECELSPVAMALNTAILSVSMAVEFDNVEAIKRAVEVGSGISILPQPTLEREVTMGTLRAAPFTGPRLVRPLGIIHRRGKRFNPAVERFVQLLQKEEGLARRGARTGR